MDAGPELMTLEQLGTYSAMQKRGEISEKAIGLLQATRLSLVRGLFVLWERRQQCRLWRRRSD